MEVTVILIVIGALCTVTKGFVKGLEDLEIGGGVETVQTTAFLKSAKHQEESWTLVETCYHSDSRERPSANFDVKKSSQRENIIIRLCGDINETISHIIRECSKLVQKVLKTG